MSSNGKFAEFFDMKMKIFLELLDSKQLNEINRNTTSLKLLYSLGMLGIFIKEYLIPLKDKILNRDSEVFEIIMPKNKIDELITLFSEQDKEKIFSFVELMVDSVDYL